MKTIVAICLCLCSLVSYSQKRDYTWLTGYSSWGGYDAAWQYWFGISKFDFHQQPMDLSYDSLGMNFSGANFTMGDEAGNVQFYTNGVTVRNSYDGIIVDSIHNGFFLNYVGDWHYSGNPNDAMMCVLPNPLIEDMYDIFYVFGDTLPSNLNVYFKHTMRTQVDMSANFGKGELVYKDSIFNSVVSSNSLAAVRHANGRDWWLVTMKQGTNCYQVFLYDGSSSIQAMPLICPGGFTYNNGETAVHRFSPSGNTMMSTNNEQGRVDFFEFDRCGGTLSLIGTHIFPERVDSVGAGYLFSGCEFSPNSRYAYVCGTKRLYQFDITGFPIASTRKIIANYYPYQNPAPVTYNLAQLGPDGKIYISSRNGTYYMAVINNPDEAGVNCNFQDTVKTPSFILGLPFYPNYRLGAEANSPCDTLTSIKDIAEKEKMLKVFPNPANDIATIDYGYTDWSKGETSMEITNSLGQTVHSQNLPMYSGFQKLQVANYPSGSYTVYIKRKGNIVAVGRLVKE